MTEKLRLGPLPKTETVRLAITLSVAVKADLDRYPARQGQPLRGDRRVRPDRARRTGD